jgi:hypothetical protein
MASFTPFHNGKPAIEKYCESRIIQNGAAFFIFNVSWLQKPIRQVRQMLILAAF